MHLFSFLSKVLTSYLSDFAHNIASTKSKFFSSNISNAFKIVTLLFKMIFGKDENFSNDILISFFEIL